MNDIPFYVIDFRTEIPTVINYDSTLFDSIVEVRKAISAAASIQTRFNIGWRCNGLHYTIGDLFSTLVKL